MLLVPFERIQTVESVSNVGGWDPVCWDHDAFSLLLVSIQGQTRAYIIEIIH